jgi:DNA polymerase-3 subunit gamma/tau
MADEVPYQSLYRRYRPQRFGEVRGQEHVVKALRNAVRSDRVGHAYLFSGPRGTGKTTTARILAKALNCTNLQDGEPCCECESCIQVQRGTSLDVQELDAASNNGVDAMRDLVSRAALGTPGRWKVYIVDEVHMLSNAASNTLLKTLEEPPAHVVFVLATTDPQKVLPTIRSRTQHLEFRLMSADVLGGLLADINTAAGLNVAPEAIDLVVRRGKGSARDALSALDQVAAAGEVDTDDDATDEIVEALCERDPGRALMAVAQACSAGRDARRVAEDLLSHLRNAFLATMARSLVMLPDDAAVAVEEQGRRLGPAGITRAVDEIGSALADMREALDPRVSLEVALVRLTRPDSDTSTGALLERIERLERAAAGGTPVATASPSTPTAAAPVVNPPEAPTTPAPAHDSPPTQAPPEPTPPAPSTGGPPGAAEARAALATVRGPAPKPKAPSQPVVSSGPPPVPPPGPPKAHTTKPVPSAEAAPTAAPPSDAPAAGPGGLPSRDDIVKAWGDSILTGLKPGAKARFAAGRFVDLDDDAAVFALPNAAHRDQCEAHRGAVETALAAHFGRPIKVRLTVDTAPSEGSGASRQSGPDEEISRAQLEQLEDATAAVTSPEDRLREAFPGAEEVTP